MHQLAAFFFQDAAYAFCLGVKGARGVETEAALGIGGAVDDAGQLGPSDGTGTHGARLHGDVERAVTEVFAAQLVSCHRDGLHLGMGGDVGERLRQVVSARYDAIFAHDNRSNGYLALLQGWRASSSARCMYCSSLVMGFSFFLRCFDVSMFSRLNETDFLEEIAALVAFLVA